MFSKQHFEKIAKLAINNEAETKTEFLKELASMFKADNQKFNTEKFFLKSGLNQEFNKGNTISKSVCGLDISVPRLTDLRVILGNLKNSRLKSSLGTESKRFFSRIQTKLTSKSCFRKN